MTDDIVTRLRELMADLLYNPDCDDEGCGDCAWHRVAADAIDEIKRLRVAGDALAAASDALAAAIRTGHAIDNALEAWDDARRG